MAIRHGVRGGEYGKLYTVHSSPGTPTLKDKRATRACEIKFALGMPGLGLHWACTFHVSFSPVPSCFFCGIWAN